jgi:hypothetical protein
MNPNTESVSSLDPNTVDKIIALAKQERELSATASTAEDERRNIQHLIKETLRKAGLRTLQHEGIRIVWSPVVGRPAIDMPKLKEAAAKVGLDIQQFERVGEPSDRLIITTNKR